MPSPQGRPLALAVLVCLASSVAAADVVHLTNGSEISGEVVSESEREVVVKTPRGKVTLPRRLVDRIERSSGDETLLELAKERLRGGSREAGIKLLEQAAKSKDASVASRAKAQLARLEAKAEASQRRSKPRTSFPIPTGISGKPSEGATLQEQFDRLRLALDRRDGPRALALLRSLRRDNPEHSLLRYLEGRAHELSGEPQAARASLLAALGGDARRVQERELGWVADLARRAAAGETLDRKRTPGFGSSWYRVAGETAALYSLHELDPRLAGRLDDLADEARRVFDLRARESDLDGRIQIGLCVDLRELRRLGEVPLRSVVADGVLWRRNCLARDLKQLGPQLVARAILERAAPGTPEWAATGAAQRLRSSETRSADRARARQAYAAAPPTLRAILDGAPDPAGDPAAWRGLLGIVVDLLQAERRTLRRALTFTTKIERLGGAEKALRRFRIDVEAIEAKFREALSP